MAIRKTIWLIFRTMHKDFKKGMSQVRNGLTTTQYAIDRMRKPLKRLGATIERQRMGFQMWALGVMFFGMQMLRVFSRIAKSSFDTFEKVMGESINTAREGIMGLSASWEMLKFSIANAIASAIEPLVPMILNIIDAVSDWIERNPKLTAALVLLGIALGGIMFFVGQLVLFISSLMIFWVMWGSAIWTVIGYIASLIGSVGLGGLLLVIGLVMIAVAVLMSAWKKNWFGFRTIVIAVTKVIWNTIKVWLDTILEIFGLVWELIVALFTGEWGKIPGILMSIGEKIMELFFEIFFGIFKIVWAISLGIVAFLTRIWLAVWDKTIAFGMKMVDWFKKWWGMGGIMGIVVGIAEAIVNKVIWMINAVLGVVRAAMRAANDILGFDFDAENFRIKDADFSGAFGEENMYEPAGNLQAPVNVIVQGNVIGEEEALKKLGEQIQANMRTSGNNSTIF